MSQILSKHIDSMIHLQILWQWQSESISESTVANGVLLVRQYIQLCNQDKLLTLHRCLSSSLRWMSILFIETEICSADRARQCWIPWFLNHLVATLTLCCVVNVAAHKIGRSTWRENIVAWIAELNEITQFKLALVNITRNKNKELQEIDDTATC